MKLDLSFELPCARDVVWPAFGDVALLVDCLPGAALRSAPEERPLKFDFAVKLGPIGSKFSGEGDLVFDQYAGRLSGTGVDRATSSRVKGEAGFRLEETADGTRVVIEVDFALTGMLAQFGRGAIVKEVASNITARFGANLQARLEGAASGSAPAAADAGAPLDAGRLVWDMMKKRFTPRSGGGDAT